MAALACSYASSRAETLNSDNLSEGFSNSGGASALASGRLRIGIFRTLNDAAVTTNANNLQALQNDFVPLVDSSQTFNTGSTGFFARSDAFSGGAAVYSTAGGTATITYDATPGVHDAADANLTDMAGKTVYIWVLNSNNLATATEHAIFKTTTTLPDSDVVPPTEVTVGTSGAVALVGSAGTGTTPAGSHVLAPITAPTLAPEIQVFVGPAAETELQTGGSVGYTGVLTFTVRNIGTGALNLASATLSNPADFSTAGFAAGSVNPVVGANEEAFTVTWDTFGLGGTKTTTLTIANDDPNEPSFVLTINAGDLIAPATAPVVTTPTANQNFTLANLGDTVTVNGTATDNFAVTDVQVSLNNGPWVAADLAKEGTPSTAFTLAITPNAGVNTLRVRTVDAGGNFSPITSRVFNVFRPLEINIVGGGSVAPAATFLPSPKNFQVGKVLTISAVPTAGNIFTGWTVGGGPTLQQIGVTPGALEKAALTFTFRAGLTLTANFQPNPFFALAGAYNGLVEETFRAPNISANSSHGFFKADVTSTGAFTGKLTIDGFVLNVNGAFDHTGVARFGTARLVTIDVGRTNKPSLKVSLNASLTAPFTIQGTVKQTAFQKSNIVAESSVDADRAFYGVQVVPVTLNPGSPNVVLASTSGLTAGAWVTGTGIPANSAVTAVTSGITSGSPDIGIPAASVAGRIVGEKVTGTGIPVGATILSISGNIVSGPLTAGITDTVATVTLASTAGRIPGEAVTGAGIQANTTILTVNSATQITLSLPANATNPAAALTFTKSKVTLTVNATATSTPTVTFTTPTRVLAVNGSFEIVLSANPTVAVTTNTNLTFTRDLGAEYLTTLVDGTHNMILPSREAYYSVGGTFEDTLDYFDPGDANNFQEDDIVVFEGTSLPAGITAGQNYFVVNKTDLDSDLDDDEFQVSLTQGGAAINFTGIGSDVSAVLDPDARQVPGLAAEDFPQGFGSGTIKVTKTGTVTLAGTLADGTTVSGTTTISAANEAALFSSIYTNAGFFSTQVKLNNADANSDISALTPAKWMRPAILTSHYYPAGWTDVIEVDLLAARYFGTGSVVKREDDGGTTDGDALADELIAPDTANGNAELQFAMGQIEEGQTVTKTVSISATNAVTEVPDPLDPTFSLTLAAGTGVLGGDFIHTNDTKPLFKGIVYQKGSWAGGWGYFLTTPTAPINYTGESGFMGLFGFAP